MGTDRHTRLECALLALALSGCAADAAAQGWAPKRNVEIVVGFAAGGSQDQTARMLERLFVTQKLVNVPVSVINKPGGSGVIGATYVSQRPADGHTLLMAGPSLISGYITGSSALSYTEFTPIAVLFNDCIAFSLNAASPTRTGKDLLERLRKDPKSVSVGIVAVGGGTHTAALLLYKAIGGSAKDLKVVSFKAGNEVVTNLMGGHIELAATTAVAAHPLFAAGRLRIVAVAAARRVGGALAGVPTWQEQGVDVVVRNWRSVMAPGGMGAAQSAYWENVLRKVSETAEWKADLERNLLVDDFAAGAQFRKELDKEYAEMKSVLGELGLAKH